MKYADTSKNLGVIQINPQAATDGSLSIIYLNGDTCRDKQRYSTRIIFQCDQTMVIFCASSYYRFKSLDLHHKQFLFFWNRLIQLERQYLVCRHFTCLSTAFLSPLNATVNCIADSFDQNRYRNLVRDLRLCNPVENGFFMYVLGLAM